MEVFNKEEQDVLLKYGRILASFKKIERLKIALMLLGKELSFADIRKRLGNNYNTGLLYHDLKELQKDGIIVNIKKLDLSSDKPKISFYKLTEEAEDFLRKLIELMRKK